MGDRVVNELIALLVFLKEGRSGRGKGKGEGGKKMWRRGKRGLLTDLWRHLTVQV
jgi:hypothetical protein